MNLYCYNKNHHCKCGKKITNLAKKCKKCWYIFHRGKNHTDFIDGRSLKTYYCNCGKKISPGTVIYGKGRCYSCAQKNRLKNPKNHPSFGKYGKLSAKWIGGYCTRYTPEFNIKLKESIRKRDDCKCQKCNVLQKNYNRKLAIHHIDYDKDNCKEKNLITLCQKCNSEVNANRDYWFAYFTYIMENK